VSTWAVTSWIEQAALDETPLVSVILPTHNRSHLLQRAIESVRSQVYPSWEVVVVDDGSTDDTPTVVERLRCELDEGRVQAVRIPPSGVCAARNRGLALAKGSLIAYLDDDNLMHPLWLKAVVWAFSQRPDVDVVYGGIIIDDILRVNRPNAGALPSFHLSPFDRQGLTQYNLADIGAIAHRSGLPEARFDETLREMGDWDLLVRLTREKAPLVLPMIACFYSTAAPDRLSGGPTFEADAARVRAKAR
jgi:glycosyltransferase involved in cell wall biosynthesis